MHLITGGSGFVGSAIARRLIERGEKVRVLDVWRAADLPSGAEFVLGDVTNAADVAEAVKGVKYVHHNAALVPLTKAGTRYREVNVTGTRIVLEAAKKEGVRFFAHMSSSAVFGCPDEMPITNATPREPIEIYGHSKKIGEDIVLEEMEKGELPISIIRPRTIIGTGRLGIFQILFDWIRDGANIYTIGKGEGLFQFVHIDDLSDTSILSCLKEKPGVYNVGTDDYGTLKGDLTELCNHAGTGSRVKSLPQSLTIGTLKALDHMGLSPLSPWHYLTYHKPFYFDSSPVYEALDWKPKYSNREMMLTSYDWFVKNYDSLAVDSDGSSHKKPVKQKVLRILKSLS